jgi:hypothetical protein
VPPRMAKVGCILFRHCRGGRRIIQHGPPSQRLIDRAIRLPVAVSLWQTKLPKQADWFPLLICFEAGPVTRAFFVLG